MLIQEYGEKRKQADKHLRLVALYLRLMKEATSDHLKAHFKRLAYHEAAKQEKLAKELNTVENLDPEDARQVG